MVDRNPLHMAVVLATVLTITDARSQDSTAQQNAVNTTFRIEFLGKNFSEDWARVASLLVDQNLAPVKQVALQPGEGKCNAALRALNFRSQGIGCSTAIDALIAKMNPNFPNPASVGTLVNYPDLPVTTFDWTALFDRSLPGEADRYNQVVGAWRRLQVDEKSKGSQVQLGLRGYQTAIEVPNTEDAKGVVKSVDSFDPTLKRLHIRSIAVTDKPIAKSPFSAATPRGWYRSCRNSEGAAPPKPPYVTFLGAPANPACVKACGQPDRPCPEIVLIDKKIHPHPDIVRALGLGDATPPPDMCKHVSWSTPNHHATHLAGIMVGADRETSFPGIAPAASLTGQTYDDMKEPDVVKLVRDKSWVGSSRPTIFVFASKFSNADDTLRPLADPNMRRETPSFIPEILNSANLWVVAAGNGTDGKNLGSISPDSPMNLGDVPTILVVTACEDCLTDKAQVPPWANYSKENLVNVAADGGSITQGIPGPATAIEYSEGYGTSQSAAMVGGLAAAMLSCYPTVYKDAKTLKIRIQATSRPPASQKLAERVSAGTVDAEKALLDPRFHWMTTVGQPRRKAVELQWCRQHISLKHPGTDDPLRDGLFSTKNIRQIVRRKNENGQAIWHFVREPEVQRAADVIATGPATLFDESALLRVKYEDGTTSPLLKLDEIENLVVGLKGDLRNIVVPPERCRT